MLNLGHRDLGPAIGDALLVDRFAQPQIKIFNNLNLLQIIHEARIAGQVRV